MVASQPRHLQHGNMQDQRSSCAPFSLILALEHPSSSSNPQVLCAAARASKAWREAVRQCSACNADVDFDLHSSLLQLGSFTDWLQQHAGLVRNITITASYMPYGTTSIHGLQEEAHYRTACRLLQQALQVTALPSDITNPAALAVATEAPQQQQQHKRDLRLASLNCWRLENPGVLGVLAVLPPHSLTHLALRLPPTGVVNIAALSAALERLSSLQQLHLEKWQGVPMAGNCLAGITQLSRLTSLHLVGNWWGPDEELQQLLSQPLPLRHLELEPNNTLPVLDLSNMTHLEQLTMKYDVPAGTALPPQLQQLHLEAYYSADIMSAVLPLQQLQRLSLFQGFTEQQPLLQLAQLPQLQHLSLRYEEPGDAAAAAAAAWPQLPQLRALRISYDDYGPLPSQFAAVLDAVAASTQLTKLELAAWQSLDGSADAVQPVAACCKLARLQNLRDLCITASSQLVPGDVLALTALTGLMRLVLPGPGSEVDDAAVAALACSLRQLQHLDLAYCDLTDKSCAAIGQLAQLTELMLHSIPGFTRDGLMLLTGLSRLQELWVDRSQQLTDEHVEEFWAVVRPGS